MLSAQPGPAEVRPADQRATLHAEQCRKTELAKLREYISHLLTHFNHHDIALELQRLHNAQPKEVREGSIAWKSPCCPPTIKPEPTTTAYSPSSRSIQL